MEKIIITTRIFLVEGGCNACGMLNAYTYTLHFSDGQEAMMEALDAYHLAVAIALKNGFSEKVEAVGIGEDALFLEKGTLKIEMAEDDFKSTLQDENKKIVIQKKECSQEEVYQKTNEILEGFFNLKPYDFELTI